ncbi:MAG: winged helix-turn-helix transcriptional regulator [Candidatus Eremiobacteraeota bacterium]|nr:winged helix-turn-helix transcriptional regulator [Candidatus Eremiobacteraeota bacterium]MBV8365467.1 winged helix-turn-helix transcriptional regulator [Candidatus Eremiobacteraeota bacterium]
MSIQRTCPRAKVDKRERDGEAALFRALADPYRLRMIATLARTKHEICVCDFTDAFPLRQPAVSHHLSVLREAGIVKAERRGTWVYYRLADDFFHRLDAAVDAIVPRRAAA